MNTRFPIVTMPAAAWPDGRRIHDLGMARLQSQHAVPIGVEGFAAGQEVRHVGQHAVEVEGALVEDVGDRHVAARGVVDAGDAVDLAQPRLDAGTPPAIVMEIGAIVPLAGSRSAFWNAGVCEAAATFEPTLLVAPEKKMVRKTAVPNVPPIDRKKVADEVATPIWVAGTEFWVARISVCIQQPRPAPTRNINGARWL